jgi:hypothetical protein
LALIISGWKYTARSWQYMEVSVNSPAGIPIFQFKTVMVAAGILLLVQGVAQVFRCIICIRTGEWLQAAEDIEETEVQLAKSGTLEVMKHGTEAIDIFVPDELSGKRGNEDTKP